MTNAIMTVSGIAFIFGLVLVNVAKSPSVGNTAVTIMGISAVIIALCGIIKLTMTLA